MPRSFDMSADYEGSVEEVHRTLGDPGYWQARLAESQADETILELLQVGGDSGDDGTIEVITVQVLHGARLPGLITQLHRGDLSFRREERWGPIIDGAATGTVVGIIPNAPVSLSGTAVLAPIPESHGSRLTVRITLQVRIPIIGGKVENFIGNQLTGLVRLEQEFTSTYIANHA